MLTHPNKRIFEYSLARKKFARYIPNIRFSPHMYTTQGFLKEKWIYICLQIIERARRFVEGQLRLLIRL